MALPITAIARTRYPYSSRLERRLVLKASVKFNPQNVPEPEVIEPPPSTGDHVECKTTLKSLIIIVIHTYHNMY